MLLISNRPNLTLFLIFPFSYNYVYLGKLIHSFWGSNYPFWQTRQTSQTTKLIPDSIDKSHRPASSVELLLCDRNVGHRQESRLDFTKPDRWTSNL